jgi:hypothetical protein
MKYIKTNEAISLSNKKIISNFDKLIDRIDTEYNSGDWKTIRSNAHLFTGRSKKDIIKNTTLIISNKEYKIVLTLTLLKEGLDRIQRLIANPSIAVKINVSSKVSETDIESSAQLFDLNSFNDIKEFIERNTNLLIDKINKDSKIKDFYDEYDEETITDYLWDLRDLLNGNFKISKFKYGKGFIVSILTGKDLPYIERHDGIKSKNLFEIDDNYVNTLVELNNISKTLKSIGLTLRYSIEHLKGGLLYFIITEADQ